MCIWFKQLKVNSSNTKTNSCVSEAFVPNERLSLQMMLLLKSFGGLNCTEEIQELFISVFKYGQMEFTKLIIINMNGFETFSSKNLIR